MKKLESFFLRAFSTLRGFGKKRKDDRLSDEELRLIKYLRKAKDAGEKVPVDIDILNSVLKNGPFSSIENIIRRLTIIVINNGLSENSNGTASPRKRLVFFKVLLEIILALFSGLATYLLFKG